MPEQGYLTPGTLRLADSLSVNTGLLDSVYTLAYTFCMHTTIQKWGNSYAVRLPKATVRKLKLSEGRSVKIVEDPKGRAFRIVVAERAVSLNELVKRITIANRHTETSWGVSAGREA